MEHKYLQYKKDIIRVLSFGKKLTAHEISLLIDKSLPLTNRILEDMVKSGILQDEGFALSTGGRRPALYSIAAGNMYVLSIAMDQYITRFSIIDLHDQQLSHLEKFPFPLVQHQNKIEELTEKIQQYLNNNYVEKEKILGIGIGMPGFVDVKKSINHSYFTDLKDGKNITDSISEVVNLPVFLDNDSSVIAITEHEMGVAKGSKNSLIINFGWGIGLGMILDGELYRGHNGFAGEFSHIPLFNNNRLCTCGKSGCLETEASMLVIINETRMAIKSGRATSIQTLPDDLEAASDMVIAAALSGDQLAVELFSQAAYDIGKGIAILIHILNPEQIIISGRGAAAGGLLLAPIYQAINKYCIPSLSSYTQIIISKLTKFSELYGGAMLVAQNFDKKHIAQLENSTTLS